MSSEKQLILIIITGLAFGLWQLYQDYKQKKHDEKICSAIRSLRRCVESDVRALTVHDIRDNPEYHAELVELGRALMQELVAKCGANKNIYN